MRIKALTLQDVGLFRGRQTIDLAPRKKYGVDRPVVLVGGHNGAGKTTILGSLQLALYGRLALGPRVTDREYQDHLRGLIHRRKDTLIPLTAASVAVDFEHSQAGKRSTYTVQRAWELRDQRVEERMTVLRDGAPLSDVEAEFWPEFVRSLVPYGLSQLFFFDGEKIQRLAETETESEALAESMKALLGLDLVERLQADLDVLIERRARANSSGQRGKRLDEIKSRLNEIDEEDGTFQSREAQLRTKLDQTTGAVDRIERKLAHAGKGLTGKRGELRDKAAELKSRIESTEKIARDLCDGALPFALCPALCEAVVEQLNKEAAAERWLATRDDLKVAFTSIRKRLNKRFQGNSRLLSDARDIALAEVEGAFKDLETSKKDLSKVASVHDVSEQGRAQLRHALGPARVEAAGRLAVAAKELLTSEEKLTATQRKLNVVPENDELRPLVEELSKIQLKRGELTAQLATLEESRQRLTLEREKLERERKKIVEADAGRTKEESHLSLANRTRSALDTYLQRLTVAKVERLQVEALTCFKQLCRKEDLIESMRIDPRSYHVTLFDRRGRELPKQDLSAGEKQLYAVALLWAMARVSGRPLPMVVDTPLGRLDSIHRQNLIERYFPHASHQVIVLSTDTEVDHACFETLKISTSHAVHLNHHQKEGWTEVGPGYFWRTEKGEALAVANA